MDDRSPSSDADLASEAPALGLAGESPMLLPYRSPIDEPPAGTGGVLRGAAAIFIAGLSVLMGAPGVEWLLKEGNTHRETGRIIIACVIVFLGLGGLTVAVMTARDYLSGRNARPRQRGRP